jgi:hypothetical protein
MQRKKAEGEEAAGQTQWECGEASFPNSIGASPIRKSVSSAKDKENSLFISMGSNNEGHNLSLQ